MRAIQSSKCGKVVTCLVIDQKEESTKILIWNTEGIIPILIDFCPELPETSFWDHICYSLSKDGNLIAAGSGNSIWIWDINQEEQIKQIHVQEDVVDIDFSPNGSHLVFSTQKGTVQFLRVNDWKEYESANFEDGCWVKFASNK